MELEPNTKLREWQVKERWEIDQIKLAEYVYKDGLRAYDIHGRQIRFFDLQVAAQLEVMAALRDGKILDLNNALENQLVIFAPIIAQFISDDIIDFEREYDLYKTPHTSPAMEPTHAPQVEPQAENYFRRTDSNHWAIKFQDEFAAHLDHLDGLLYIAHILNTKDGSISDIQLYSIAKGAPQADSNEKMAISNNLSDQIEYQESHDPQAHRDILAKFKQLGIDLENAESELEKAEIKKEINNLLPFLKQRNIAGQEQKSAQANITKRLEVAYKALESEGMKKLANHLKQCITTAIYSRVYTGGVIWEIFL